MGQFPYHINYIIISIIIIISVGLYKMVTSFYFNKIIKIIFNNFNYFSVSIYHEKKTLQEWILLNKQLFTLSYLYNLTVQSIVQPNCALNCAT